MFETNKETKEKKDKVKAENWKTYLRIAEKGIDKALDRKEYAVKQFDYLMIAISIAALGFISNYIKDESGNLSLARASQLVLMICLFSNLFSHIFSMWSNSIGYKKCTKEFEVDSYGEEHIPNFNKKIYERKQRSSTIKIKILNLAVRTLNIISFISLITGISLFIYFTFIS